MQQLSESPSNEDKLALYALYKQATAGPNNTKKPGTFDIVGKYKWQAWTDLGAMPAAEAEKQYIALCQKLGAKFTEAGPAAAAAPAATASSAAGAHGAVPGTSGTVLIANQGNVRTLTLNRPEKKNALTFAMYTEVIAAMETAAADPSVNVLVLTGAGSFFCSGNDLTNFAEAAADPPAFAEKARGILHGFVNAFITFPKMLVVGVNGPAVGIATTVLPLADLVYASSAATFHAPLASLGQTPEGTSSYLFPARFGYARATELLVAGRKLSAEEAASWGFVNEVFEAGSFAGELGKRVAALAGVPPKASMESKRIMRGRQLAELQKANDEECATIKKAWLGPECAAAVMKFLSRPKAK